MATDQVDLVFRTRTIRATYAEPWRFLLWRGQRTVTRSFVVRELPLRQVLLVQETMRMLQKDLGRLDLVPACAVIVGKHVLYAPQRVLQTIWDAYVEFNLQPSSEDRGAATVALDAVVRRLERAPFGLEREQVMDMTCRQIAARLKEWGDEEVARLAAEAAARGAS